jgi:NAD(P)-dependent dehydrogenase (short-subunit alcohol dehydrogenase family)
MAAMLQMLKGKWLTPPEEPTESFTGKNIIVTGANTGLGFEAACKFSALDASKLILAVRDQNKGDSAKLAIEARTGKMNQIEVWNLDMSSYESIQSFTARAHQLDHLDIAILNAGVRRATYNLSRYCWEEDLQVNLISTILLGLLLIPKLKDSKRITGNIPVLEFVNSGFHQTFHIPKEKRNAANMLKEYNAQEAFTASTQYAISKLFLMFATNKLAAINSSHDILITSMCPGAVATELSRDYNSIPLKIAVFIFVNVFTRRADVGARSIVSGVLQGEKAHGRFWQHDIIKPLGPSLIGEENESLAEKVWLNVLDALAKDVPIVKELVQ